MKSNTGHPLERRVAATFQASGAFIERNHKFLAHNYAEFDVVATTYLGGLSRCVVEVSGGENKGKAQALRLLHGDRGVIGAHAAVFLVQSEPDPMMEPLRARLARIGTHMVYAPDENNVGGALRSEGHCLRTAGPYARVWEANYEAMDALRQAVGKAAEQPGVARTIKTRMNEIRTALWIADPFERLRALARYERFLDRRLTYDAADELYAHFSNRRYRAFEALRDPSALVVAGAAYVQHQARLHYAKAVVDAAMLARADGRLLHALDESGPKRQAEHVRLALENLQVAAYLPSIMQVLMDGLGGFLWDWFLDKELAFLAFHAGCDVETAQAALDLYPKLVEYDRNWWYDAGNGKRAIKIFPAHLHGAGAAMRDVLHGSHWTLEAMHPWRAAYRHARRSLKDPHGRAPRRKQPRRTAA